MSNPFLRDFDTLFTAILTDYQNQFPEADVSQGSLIYIKSACLASALWGLYKYMDYAGKQIFPDTADTENLAHHGWIYNLTKTSGETDAAFLARILTYIRTPPAGGNAVDYERWALEVTGVKAAYCVPIPQGAGTVDVLILADDEDELPDETLLDAVYDYIDALRPVTGHTMRVMAPTITEQDVTMTLTGDADPDVVEADISAHISSLTPGDTLYLSKLFAIAITNGATNAVITEPAADVTPAADEILRPGIITVS